MPNFFDQFDAPQQRAGGNFFDRFDPGYKPPEEPGDTWRGLKESFQQLPQLGYGILAGAGAAAENVVGEGGIATGIKKAGVKGYTEWGDKIAAGSKPSDSIDYSWEQAKQGNFGALVDWLQHGIGYVGGQGLQMLATAGIGAAGGKLVAGTAAKQIAEGMVAKESARLAAAGIAADQIEKAAVANVASKFATIGMNTALGGAAVGMEGGEIFGGLTQEAEKEGRKLTGGELGKAFGATLAAGGLEFVGDKLGLDIVLGKSKFLKPAEFAKGITGRAGRGLIAGGLQAPIEAGTEYGQTLLEEYGKGNDPTSGESLKQARESAWLGALGGAVVGGVGGAIQPAKPRPQEERPITDGIDKIAAAGSVDEAIAATAQVVSGKSSEPTPAERIASVKASVDMDSLRAKYGDQSAAEFLNSLAQAQNPRVPQAVREKHLQAVETLLFELNASRAAPDPLALPGPAAQPALGYEGAPLQIGMGSTPTGTMRVGPDGQAFPETVADLNAPRAPAPDGMVDQAPIGGTPGAGVMVGTGTLQTTARPAPAAPLALEAPTRETAPQPSPTVIPAEVAAPAGEVRGTEPAVSGPVLPTVEANASGRVDSPATAVARDGRETVFVGAASADAEQALSVDPLSLGKEELNRRIADVVAAGDAPDSIRGLQVLRRRFVEATGKSSIPPAGSRLLPMHPAAPAQSHPNPAPEVVAPASGITSESGAELGTDLTTLKRQWQDAVRANDSALATRINARIVEVKNAGQKAPAAEPAQTVPESDLQEALRTARAYKSRPAAEDAAQAAGPEYIVHGEPGNWRIKKSDAPGPAPVTKKRPPASFRKKHQVKTQVFSEESGQFEERSVSAESALKALDDDVAELVADGMTADAAWLQVTQAKLDELSAERARIEQDVADAYAKTPAGARATTADKPRVFKSRKAAEAERDALGNEHKLQKIKGGFILRRKTDKEMAAEARNGKRLSAGASGKRTLLTVIAAGGGLNLKDRADTIGEGNRNVGGKMLFTNEGKSIHEWAESLHEGGWMPVDESEAVSWLQKAIADEYAGRAEHFQMSDEESLAKQVEAARGDEPDPLAPFDMDELDDAGYAAASPDVQAATEELLAAAEVLGIDTEALREDAARATAEDTQEAYHAEVQRLARDAIEAAGRNAQGADTGAAGRGGEDRVEVAGGQGQEGLTLEAQDADSLRAKTEREARAASAEKAEQKRLEDKARADAQRGEFALTGSDRAADVAVAQGQGDIFAEAVSPPAEKAAQSEAQKIEDIGEKIGGARKDTAVSTGPKRQGATDDDRPAWARRFKVNQIVTPGGQLNEAKDAGRWVIYDSRSLDWTGQPKQVGRSTYATKEEAEAFVPLAAVAMKHRVVATSGDKYEIWRDITDRKRVKVVDRQFESRDDALAYMLANAVSIIETNTTFGEADLPLPPNRSRIGPPRRTSDVAGEDFKNTFGFRGVEFGNWNNQDERQALMNDAWDGLMDLADVLGVPPRALGLNGDLALAFGARGQGLQSARAHYENERAVINLTKEKGAGSLAHEFFHALDHYFGRQDGKASATWEVKPDGTRTLKAKGGAADFLSGGASGRSGVRQELRSAYEHVLTTMSKKAEAYVEDMAKVDKFTGRAREELATALDKLRKDLSEQKDVRYWKRNNKPASAEHLAEFDAIAAKMVAGEMLTTDWRTIGDLNQSATKRALIAHRWTNDALEQISAIYKATRGRSGFDSTNHNGVLDNLRGYMNRYSQRLKLLADAQGGVEKTKAVPTDFAMNARELDQGRGTDYWTTPHEMAARAFQGYVEDRIAERGGESRFLNYAPANAVILTPWGWKRPYPAGEERKAINAAFDKLIGELKTRTDDAGNVALYSRSSSAQARPTEAAPTQSSLERRTSNAEPFADLLDRVSFGDEGLRGLDIPSQRMVLARVVSMLHDAEIRNRVVQLVPVDVVHDLAGKKGAPNVLLNDPSVLKNVASINSDNSIPVLDVADALVRGVAQAAAEQVGSLRSRRNAIRDDSALRTGERGSTALRETYAGAGAVGAAGRPTQFRGSALEDGAALDTLDDRHVVTPTSDGVLGAEDGDTASVPPIVRRVEAVRGAAVRELGEEVVDALERAGLLRFGFSPTPGMPSDVAGVTSGGTISVFAKNANADNSVLLHEALHATLRQTIGDEAFDALMARMPALVAGNKAFFSEARIPADTPAAARNAEVASYAVEAYQRNRETMPKGVRRWVEDLIAALKAGLAKALQAAGFGLKIRVRLLSDAKVLRVLARDGLRGMASGSMRGEPGGAFAFSKAPPTDTAAFKAWFGDSKVVDAQGKPLVVYHGTTADLSAFDLSFSGSDGVAYDRPAIFATDDARVASDYARNKLNRNISDAGRKFQRFKNENPGVYDDEYERRFEAYKAAGRKEGWDIGVGANVLPIYLSVQNPMYVDGGGRRFMQVMPDAVKQASAQGRDGVIVRNVIDHASPASEYPVTVYVAFRPEQIKSAIGNSGQFDPTNPDIRYSIADSIRNAGGGPQIVGQTSRQYTPAQKAAMRNVGFEVDKPTLETRVKELWRDAGKKLAQGLADQFAPVKDLSKDAYALMRLSKGASGAFETLLQGGKLKLTDNVYDFDETSHGGVVESLLTPLQGEHHDFFRWVAANRAERLTAEGREHLFTPADIQALKTLADGTMAADYTIQTGPRAGQTTRDRTLVYADAQRVFSAFNKNVLDMAEQSGLIDGASRSVWERDFYVPFYRVADDGGIAGVNVKSGAVRQEAFKTLKGGKNALNADLLDNTLMNWSHLLDAAAKNRGAKATLEAAVNAGIAVESTESAVREMSKAIQQKNGVVWVMDGGKKRFFLVGDPYVLSAITALEYAGMRNPVMNAMGAMKHALTVGVTASPFFKIRNLIRDSVQAIGTSELGYNAAANVAQGWKLTDPKSDEYFRLLAGGGTIHFGTMLEGSEAKRVQALVESGVAKATILDSEHKVKAFYRQYMEPAITAYNELGNRGEAVNRASLYDQLRKQGVSHAEASLQARDLMDFSMQGTFTSIRFLTQVVPFFNARIQGLYKLGRAAKEDPAKIGTVLGATAVASLSLLLAFSDDEDWKKREDWDRNNYWWFKFGGTAFRIPKPFEIGAIATLAERGFELAFDKEMTGTRFREQVLTLLGDNLSMNPIPQLVKPMLDVYANKNSFTGRPIETLGMERLAPQYRFNESTSMAARGVSTAMNAATGLVGAEALSPVQVDAMLRGYFGWLGSFVVGAGDALARPATGQAARPSVDVWKMATGGMVSDLRDAPSRYVSEVYKQAKEMEQAYGTWKMLIAEGKGDEAREFYADHREAIAGHKSVERIKRTESQLNQRIRAVEQGDLDADAKRAQIRTLQAMKDRAARQLIQPGG